MTFIIMGLGATIAVYGYHGVYLNHLLVIVS